MQLDPDWAAQFSQWAARWEVLAGQMMDEAAKWGGTADSTSGQVRLHAPSDSNGTCLRVQPTVTPDALKKLDP